MNISEINNAAIVDSWIDFESLTITEVKEQKNRTKANKLMVKVRTTDHQSSDTLGMWLYADKQFAPQQTIRGRGMVKEYQNIRYLDYVKAEVINGQQAPPQPPQTTNSKKEVDWDAKECRSHRAMCMAYAKDLVVAGKIEASKMDKWVKARVTFIWDGIADRGGQPNPDYEENPAEPTDDIPF